MKKIYIIVMLASILLFTVLSAGAFAAENKAKSIGKIITISGKVEVKKVGTKKFIPVSVGYAIFEGDTLRVSENAKATVAFQNGTVVNFPAASDIVLTEAKKKTEKKGSMLGTIAKNIYNAIVDKFDSGKETEKVSMVAAIRGRKSSITQLYPRNESITENKPVFTWNDSIKGNIYRISIYSKDGFIWSGTSDANQLVYPDNAPVLEEGKYYFWQVITEGEPESEIAENAFFMILSDEQINTLRSGEGELKSMISSYPQDTVSYILLGAFYESYNLYSQAVAQYDKALELKPADAGIKNMRTGVRNKQGFLDK